MLETIREYVFEKLGNYGENEDVQDRHLAYFVDYTEEAERNTLSDRSVLWLRKLGKEIDNIWAAVDWSIETEKASEALRLVGALISSLFQSDSPREWQKRLDRVLSMPGGQGKTPERAKALYGISELYWSNVNPVDKTAELQEALAIGKHLGDKFVIARALSSLGLFASLQDNLKQARSYLEQSLVIFDELAPVNRRGATEALIYLGDVAFIQSQFDEARKLYQKSANMLQETGDKISLALAIRRLGQLALHEGDYDTAVALCENSLKLNYEIEDLRGIIACISAFAAIALARGQVQIAAQLFGAVQTLLSAMNFRFLRLDRIEYERNLAALHAQFDQASLENSRASGAAMTIEQAVEFALNLVN
jgi:tetratricopeptide (TPR) repeat protein